MGAEELITGSKGSTGLFPCGRRAAGTVLDPVEHTKKPPYPWWFFVFVKKV